MVSDARADIARATGYARGEFDQKRKKVHPSVKVIALARVFDAVIEIYNR